MSEFMGKQHFIWFVGVVEDRADPKHLGRLRVRCLGYHTKDLLKLPTAKLPWAHVMNPITNATVSGLGQSPIGAIEGSWVVGFFQDSTDAQMPIIIGTLPGVPSELPTKIEQGGDGEYPGKGFQDYKNANYPKYTETDVNRLAVNDASNPHSTLTIRKADRDLAVGTSQIDGVLAGVAQTPVDNDTAIGGKWDEPDTPYDATYPYNHVYESEGGHLREVDDSPGKERLHERHSSGTGYEIHPKGTKVTRVKKDNYTIVGGDDYAHIQGTGRATIDEGLRVRVNADGEEGNNYNIEVGQGSNVNVEVNGGNINLTTLGTGEDAGDININARRSLNIQVEKDVNIGVNGKWTEVVTQNKTESAKVHQMNAEEQDINGNTINLN